MQEKQNILTVPAAIVIAGLVVGGAILYKKGAFVEPAANANIAVVAAAEAKVPAVSPRDHILGNPDAPVKIIEYSDLQCPYCQLFHTTMQQVMKEYGSKGQVAWVYRHFWSERKDPNGNIFHAKAGISAEASECVAELAGNATFWKYIDRIFQDTPQSLDNLTGVAKDTGVDEKSFTACLNSRKYKNFIEQEEYTTAVQAGVRATPWNYVVGKDGSHVLIEGAQSYATVKQIIDTMLKQP
ncbi:MAG TPA: thioredoxin domain-containing protein [Candidatus Paceibacterota bacterium]